MPDRATRRHGATPASSKNTATVGGRTAVASVKRANSDSDQQHQSVAEMKVSETDLSVRRSSRRRKTVSALELLGIKVKKEPVDTGYNGSSTGARKLPQKEESKAASSKETGIITGRDTKAASKSTHSPANRGGRLSRREAESKGMLTKAIAGSAKPRLIDTPTGMRRSTRSQLAGEEVTTKSAHMVKSVRPELVETSPRNTTEKKKDILATNDVEEEGRVKKAEMLPKKPSASPGPASSLKTTRSKKPETAGNKAQSRLASALKTGSVPVQPSKAMESSLRPCLATGKGTGTNLNNPNLGSTQQVPRAAKQEVLPSTSVCATPVKLEAQVLEPTLAPTKSLKRVCAADTEAGENGESVPKVSRILLRSGPSESAKASEKDGSDSSSEGLGLTAPVTEDPASDLFLDPVSGLLVDSAGNVLNQDVPQGPEQVGKVAPLPTGLTKGQEWTHLPVLESACGRSSSLGHRPSGGRSVGKSRSPAAAGDSTSQRETAQASAQDPPRDGAGRGSTESVDRAEEEAGKPSVQLSLEEVNQLDELDELMEAVGGVKTESHATKAESALQEGSKGTTGVKQITNEDLQNAELSKSGKRAKPQSQIVMTAYLQELVDKLQPDESCAMDKHITVHSYAGSGKRTRMTCKYCGRFLLDNHDFRRHIKSHKEVDCKPWKCPLCDYKCVIKAGIVRHINVHSDIKPYRCEECGRSFAFKQKLLIHMKYHADIRDYLCPMCNFGFHELKTLKNHLLKVHSIRYNDIRDKVPIRAKHVLKTLEQFGAVPTENLENRPRLLRWAVDKDQNEVLVPVCETDDNNPQLAIDTPVINIAPQEEDESKAGCGQEVVTESSPTACFVYDKDTGEFRSASVEEARDYTERVKLGDGSGEGTVTIVKQEDASQQDEVGLQMDAQPEAGRDVDERDQEVRSLNKPRAQDAGACSESLTMGKPVPSAGQQVMSVSVVTEEGEPMGDAVLVQIGDDGKLQQVVSQQDAPKKARKKEPRLTGPRKTIIQTKRYKEGVTEIPQKAKATFDPVTGRRKRFVNNQRCLTEDQIEASLRQYCVIDKEAAPHKIQFRCRVCSEEQVFPSKTQFIHHLEVDHPDVRPWACQQCGYQCRLRSNLIAHLKIHNGARNYSCETCGKSFLFKQKLREHMRYHANLREFKCSDCDKSFNSKHELSRHMNRLHDLTAESAWVCSICNKGFRSAYRLQMHLDSHSSVKKYLCQYCHKYYRSKTSVLQHIKSHTCMFHCEICDRNFGSYSGFMAHKVMHDESYGGYKCDMCDKVMHTKGSLKRHREIAHSTERPFACEECPKTFKTKKDLKNHMVVHSSAPGFTCEVCQFTCKRFESLRVHMRRHADVKPFQCGVCGKDYTQKHALELHLRHHVGQPEIKCHICERDFSTKFQFDKHMKEHESAEEPSNSSVHHSPAHEGMTVFMCEECNAVFLNQDSLAVHILAEHMKKGWTAAEGSNAAAGGQLHADPAGHSQVPQSSLEEMEVSDGVYGDNQVVVELPNSEGRIKSEMQEAVETLVTISDPSSQQRTVTLIHPSPTKGRNFVTTQQTMEVENEEVVAGGEVPYASTYSGGASEAESGTERSSVQNVEVQEVIDLPHSGHGQELIINNGGGEVNQETFVTFTDPNTNQEYMLAVESDTIANLLSTTVAVEGGDKDQQEYVAVAETVEIAEGSNNSQKGTVQASAVRATSSLANASNEVDEAEWTTHEIVMEGLEGPDSRVETQLPTLVTPSSESQVTHEIMGSERETSEVAQVVTQEGDAQVVAPVSDSQMTEESASQTVQSSESSGASVVMQSAESLVPNVMTQVDQPQAAPAETQSDESQVETQADKSRVTGAVAEGVESQPDPAKVKAADQSEMCDERVESNKLLAETKGS